VGTIGEDQTVELMAGGQSGVTGQHARGTIRAELERYGRDHNIEAFVQHENIFLATTEPGPVRVNAAAFARSQGDPLASH